MALLTASRIQSLAPDQLEMTAGDAMIERIEELTSVQIEIDFDGVSVIRSETRAILADGRAVLNATLKLMLAHPPSSGGRSINSG